MIGDLITSATDELRRLWIYRWLAAGVCVGAFAVAAFAIGRIPDVYDAWGQLYVNKQTPLAAVAQGTSAVGDAFGSPYVVQKTLLNDASLRRLLRAVDPIAAALPAPKLSVELDALRRQIRVAPDPGEGFVEFHVFDRDPLRARRVIDALLAQFVSSNTDRSHRDLGTAEAFLDAQIAAMDAEVARSGARLNALRRGRPDLAPAPVVEAAEPEAEAVLPAAPAPPPPPPRPSAAAERVASLQAKLTSLRATYTERYPDIVSTRRQLAEATAEVEAEPPPAEAPIALAEAAAPRRAVRRARVRRAPVVAPAVVAEWTDAQRSDDALRLRRQQLVERRDATRMSQAVYGSDGAGKFEVTRAPVTPAAPIGPNRVLYLAVAALGAVGAGLGAAYLRAVTRGVLVSPRELQSAFELPVVGTVSWRADWARRRPPFAREASRARKALGSSGRDGADVFPFQGGEAGRAAS